MPSPFPGMDPYLEGEEWSDVHQRLAAQISRQITPKITPKYVARLAVATVIDFPYDQEIQIAYPDVKIALGRPTPSTANKHPEIGGGIAVAEPVITAPMIHPIPSLRVRQVTVEIREVDTSRLVTSIEVLSPVNKRNPGLTTFREKRERLMRAGVHLLDIDLIRRGTRPVVPVSAITPYQAILTRAPIKQFEVWPIDIREQMPVVAVPLREPDADIPLDLGKALHTIYEEAAYDLTIDYQKSPPPPAFDVETQAWIAKRLKSYLQEDVT